MWKDENGRAPVGMFLGWLLFLTILVELVLLVLEPSAIAYAEDSQLTLGYAIYAVVGLLFPVAASVTAAVWYVWHLPLWLHPSSNHYGDSLIGFAMQIFVWAFAAAAIYRATGSSLACAAYHAFINSIGAIWDWNALFDARPKTGGMLLYNGIVLAMAIGLWLLCNFRRKCVLSARGRLKSPAAVDG